MPNIVSSLRSQIQAMRGGGAQVILLMLIASPFGVGAEVTNHLETQFRNLKIGRPEISRHAIRIILESLDFAKYPSASGETLSRLARELSLSEHCRLAVRESCDGHEIIDALGRLDTIADAQNMSGRIFVEEIMNSFQREALLFRLLTEGGWLTSSDRVTWAVGVIRIESRGERAYSGMFLRELIGRTMRDADSMIQLKTDFLEAQRDFEAARGIRYRLMRWITGRRSLAEASDTRDVREGLYRSKLAVETDIWKFLLQDEIVPNPNYASVVDDLIPFLVESALPKDKNLRFWPSAVLAAVLNAPHLRTLKNVERFRPKIELALSGISIAEVPADSDYRLAPVKMLESLKEYVFARPEHRDAIDKLDQDLSRPLGPCAELMNSIRLPNGN